MWNTFNRKTRTCTTAGDLMKQAAWLVGQCKQSVFHDKWLASLQGMWLEECTRVEDYKHCKYLM